MRRFLPLLLCCALGAAIACSGAGAVGAPSTFTDQDSTPLAAGTPDITGAIVANDGAQVLISAVFATETLPGTAFVVAYVDLDQNPTTGDASNSGAELAVDYDEQSGTFGVYQWSTTAQKFEQTTGSGARCAFAKGVLAWSVPMSLFGGTKGFNVWVLSGADTDTGTVYDEAPNVATYNYQLTKAAAPSTAGAAPDFYLAQGPAKMTPAKAGTAWTASLEVKRSDTGYDLGAEGKLQCKATVGGAALPSVHAGFASSGSGAFKVTSGSCTWKLPPSAHGKPLDAYVTATYNGGKVTHHFHLTVA